MIPLCFINRPFGHKPTGDVRVVDAAPTADIDTHCARLKAARDTDLA